MPKSFEQQCKEWRSEMDRKARTNRPHSVEAPQHPENRRAPSYGNNVANDWRRGAGANGRESAEGKPGFDKGK
jgi:hypothetical protein